MEDRLPGELRNLDHPRVAEELGEIAAHRARFGRVRRAEVDQKHADPWLGHVWMVARAIHAASIGSSGSERILLPVAAWSALATAGATTVVPSPLTPPDGWLLGMT